MHIDERVRTLFSRLSPGQRTAFFSCLVTGLLVHLYAFTNLIPNSDGLSRVFDLQQMTVSGRWFLHYASSLNNFTQMPAVIGFLSLLLLALAAALAVDVLKIKSGVLAALSGAVMAMFPCMGYTFLYMFTASAYCLAIFLAVPYLQRQRSSSFKKAAKNSEAAIASYRQAVSEDAIEEGD